MQFSFNGRVPRPALYRQHTHRLVPPDRVIRITGTAYIGAVTVTVKGPTRKMLERLARTFGMESE